MKEYLVLSQWYDFVNFLIWVESEYGVGRADASWGESWLWIILCGVVLPPHLNLDLEGKTINFLIYLNLFLILTLTPFLQPPNFTIINLPSHI